MDNSFSRNLDSYLIGSRNVLLPPVRQHRAGTKRKDNRMDKGSFHSTKGYPCSSSSTTGIKARDKEDTCSAVTCTKNHT